MSGKITDLEEKLTTSATDLIEVVSGGVNYKVQKSNFVDTTLTLSDITDVTASATEVNVLDGIPATLTATELGYVDGVTSSIQSQLDSKIGAGANSNITSLSGLTTPLSVSQGGTGAATLTGVLVGSGTSAVTAVTAPSGAIVGTTDTQTLTNKTLTTPIIATISNTGTVTLPTSTDTLVGKATTDTLTNKRITKRVQSVTDAATITPNADSDDCVDITAIAQAFTIANPSGTPTNFQTLIVRIKDNGTARAITFGSGYAAGGVALPTTTVLSKILTLGFIYNTANSLNKWQLIASSQEA